MSTLGEVVARRAAAAAVAFALVAGVSGCAALTGSGHAGSAAAVKAKHTAPAKRRAQQPLPFDANGTIDVPADLAATSQAQHQSGIALGEACVPDAGYDDITSGAQVTILDPSDTKIAIGSLEPGVVVKGATDAVTDARCQYTFDVSGVPGNYSLYSVHIGNTFRGEQSFSKQQLYAGVTLHLNS
ncbi:hypothetical protein [Curtobacterium sp. MCBD17_040]|uniref:hypothetical protein n=1 Tax=Curtobacterium sp. MCBD17_040 TaxID=2175674 RepID=UPI0011B486C1|nr:hypothetical protein [Curtobacterium sp. MCBD17_040]WIB65915.1 hypothetical protein DEI94_17520 [Curtobacterium sp. MCBD17_040]